MTVNNIIDNTAISRDVNVHVCEISFFHTSVPTQTAPSEESGPLSVGAIVGIVIVAVVVLMVAVVLVALAVVIVLKRNANTQIRYFVCTKKLILSLTPPPPSPLPPLSLPPSLSPLPLPLSFPLLPLLLLQFDITCPNLLLQITLTFVSNDNLSC